MTEREKMKKGLVYNPNDSEILTEQSAYFDALAKFNNMSFVDMENAATILKNIFGSVGEGTMVTPPIHANWGGKHSFWGKNCYANFNLTLVDDGNIYIGDSVMFGPNVTVCTAGHPVLPEARLEALQYNADIHIGNNVWVGAGVIILPGVTIGENSVIGAGSIVNKDIPANVVAVGNPCRVMREIGDKDKEFYFKDKRF